MRTSTTSRSCCTFTAAPDCREDPLKLNPYLTFDGRCREAFAFYEHALNGSIGTPWIVNAT